MTSSIVHVRVYLFSFVFAVSMIHVVRQFVSSGFSPGFLAALLICFQGIHAVIIRGSTTFKCSSAILGQIILLG